MTVPASPSWPPGTRRLRIDDLQIDLHSRQVIRPDAEVELTQRVFELLLVMLGEPDVLHSRSDLFKRLWPDVVVEDANLSQSIWMLRKALGPERRGWIRTVAKSGYIFEPPTAIEPVDAASVGVDSSGAVPSQHDEAADGSPPAAHPDATGADAPSPSRESAGPGANGGAIAEAERAPPGSGARPPGPTRRPLRHLAFGVAAALLLVAVVAFTRFHASHQVGTDDTLRVALIEIDDEDAPPENRWPITLMRAWLGWKLSMMPDVTLLNEAHLATHASEVSPQIVMLSGGRVSGEPDLMYVRARLDGRGGARQLEVRGPATQMPTLVDDLSRQVTDALMPGRAGEAWPALGVDAPLARRYADAYSAHRRRDFARSRRDLKRIVIDAPDFGLAHYQLSLALSGLGHANAAMEHMEAAVASLQPMPADALEVLDARRLSVDPSQSEAAAAAFIALADRYPGKRDFVFDKAWAMMATGRAADARELLVGPGWEDIPIGPSIHRESLLAQANLILAEFDVARAHAERALALAEEAGDAWVYEQAGALMQIAEVDYLQFPGRMDLGVYDDIAQRFERADAPADVLYTRFLAETRRPSGETSSQLDALLATARADGYLAIEIEILRLVALQQRAKGDYAAYRRWLDQALATAHEAGDITARDAIETDLLYETLMTGELDKAQELIEHLRDSPLQGDLAHWISQIDAYLAFTDGQYDKGLGILDRDEHSARNSSEGELPAISAARANCLRAQMQMAQGDLASARSAWSRCSEPNFAITQLHALHGLALADLLAGDREAAVEKVDIAQERAMQDLSQGPDRLDLQVQLGYMLVRAGELDAADALYASLLPQLDGGGYDWLKADVELGLAEVAAARGEWDASRRLTEAARRALPTGAWIVERRLALLEVVQMLAAGERGQAADRLTAMDAAAHRKGDAIAQLEAHSLMSPDASLKGCNPASRAALLARTGLRGAGLGWLTQSLTSAEHGMALEDHY
ncbi:winged helix-turn-helix domain-containing protein [Lysobacter sp. SG-8]|uniref:Winged helix-turn-helix domain-containing protein n=1 Tax=Marilutibacter penaei TaxID=2759900 RepID=A0A7W3U4H3_9GAMM|nr:winged helix-turn-helix domain-containing protein [Lysobacter penaei]